MARELNERQQKFLEVLFEEAGGDRTGLIKTEKVQVEAAGGVMLMPAKAKVEDED